MGWGVELDGDRCEVLAAPAAERRHRHRHRLRDLARAARGHGSRASTPSARAGCGRAATSTSRSPSRASSGSPTAARRCCGCTRSQAGKAKISTLTAGNGVETVVLIHGLGGNKTSFYETVSALTPALHGARDRPARLRLLLEARARPLRPGLVRAGGRRASSTRMGIRRAHLVGNSLGGRVAIEVGLTRARPRRAASACSPPRWPGASAAASSRS